MEKAKLPLGFVCFFLSFVNNKGAPWRATWPPEGPCVLLPLLCTKKKAVALVSLLQIGKPFEKKQKAIRLFEKAR